MIFTNDYRRLMNWPAFPLVRVAILFILGIYIGNACQVSIDVGLVLVGVSLVLTLGLHLVDTTSAVTKKIASIFLLLFFAFLGVLRIIQQDISNDHYHYTKIECEDCVISGQMVKPIKQNKNSRSTWIDVHSIADKPCRGLLLVYFNKQDSVLSYEIGDQIAICGSPQSISNSQNPLSFDYQSHMRYKGVEKQVFLRQGKHTLLQKDRRNWILHQAYVLRSKAEAILRKRLPDPEHFATAAAMVLGNREHISDELQDAFSETGAVHVLAVSGLHVGIIIMLFSLMMKKIGPQSSFLKKMFKLVVLVVIVAGYTLITGASPAVVRAAIMFSALLFGRLWYDHTNIYNILALSAILILMYDPYYLFHLGFLFSYLALTSIVFFQPIFMKWSERIYVPKTAIGLRVIQLSTVSLAAQILIFPISVYYFHKFPVYFLLSGVFAVAMAPILLSAGLLLILCDWVPYLADGIAVFMQVMMRLFLYIIYSIQSLPITSIDQVWISRSSMILMYVAIFSWMYLLARKTSAYQTFLKPYQGDRKNAVSIILLCIMGLLLNSALHDYKKAHLLSIAVYDVPKSTLVDVFDGEQSYTIQSAALDKDQANYACRDHRIYHGATDPRVMDISSDWQNQRTMYQDGMLIVEDKIFYFATVSEASEKYLAQSHVLLLTHGTEMRPYDFLDDHTTSMVLADRSVPYRTINQWRKECSKRAIEFIQVSRDGPLVMSK